MDLNELLTVATKQGPSDVHIKTGTPAMMRVSGRLVPIGDEARLTHEQTEQMASLVLLPELREALERNYDVDLTCSIPGVERFRCNVFTQRGTVGLALRIIPMKVLSLDELELPAILKSVASEELGLVLVTGTTGSGKSTTLAGMIDHINSTKQLHVMTVEDPIEHLHRDGQSIVNQREVAVDTPSFAHALRAALSQDPDIILVGEMRDLETVETGLLAAETGHLVLSTLHTLDATETINRIIAVFPPHQQRQVRLQLASVLKAVISQRLIPRADGDGRYAALEIMISTPFIRDCIVDKEKTYQIQGAIAQGTSQYGMQTFDQAIFALYESQRITLDEAIRWVSNVNEFTLRVQGIGSTSDMTRDQMAQSDTGTGGAPDVERFGV